MDEREIIDLGFSYAFEGGEEMPYHYYSLDIGRLEFVSTSNLAANVHGWSVDIVGTNIRFTDGATLKTVVNVCKDGVITDV